MRNDPWHHEIVGFMDGWDGISNDAIRDAIRYRDGMIDNLVGSLIALKNGEGGALERAEKALREAGYCEHDWKDARNKVVVSGEFCIKCGALR